MGSMIRLRSVPIAAAAGAMNVAIPCQTMVTPMNFRAAMLRQRDRSPVLGCERLEPRTCLAAGSAAHPGLGPAAVPPIDHKAPMVMSARVPTGRPFVAGETLPISVRFSERVRFSGLTGETPPTLRIDFGFYAFDATYSRGDGTRELTFDFVVPAALAGRIVGAGPITLPAGATLADAAGNRALLTLPVAATRPLGRAVVDAQSPAVLGVGRPAGAAYGLGTTIVVRMSEPCVVSGKPTLRSVIGGTERTFVYSGGTGTDRLTFTCRSLRIVGTDRVVTEPAIRTGAGSSIRDRCGNRYGPTDIPVAALTSTFFADHCREAVASDGCLDVFLQREAETITIGGESESQQVVTIAMPDYVPGFVQDTFTLLDPLLSLDFRLTTDRTRADLVVWIDTTVTVTDGRPDDPLGIAVPTRSKDRVWWEIAVNGPLVLASRELVQYVILHEFGHVMGCEHTFDGSDGDSYLGTNADTNAYADDTVMSYRGSRSGWLPAWYTRNDLAALGAIWGPETPSPTTRRNAVGS